MRRRFHQFNQEESTVTSCKPFFIVLSLILCLCVATLSQNPTPLGIRPEPPEGKGVVALRAARLIDGTGAAPINNAVVIVTDNKIISVCDARSVSISDGTKLIDPGDVTLHSRV